MKKQKIISFLLALGLLFSLAACAAPAGKPAQDVPDTPENTENAESETTSESNDAPEADEDAETADESSLSKTVTIEYSSEIPEEYANLTFPEADDDGAKLAYRLFPHYWYEDEAFEMTVAGLRKYADVVDEVTFFCDQINAAYMTDEMIEEYSGIIKKRIDALREIGIPSIGLNFMNTVGQGDYAASTLPSPPMQTAVNFNAKSAMSQLCQNSDEFKEYIAKKYKAYAETGADFIWVDDDFRADSKPASYSCFCYDCLTKFNALNGTNYGRSALVKILNSDGADPATRETREKWADFVISSYAEIMTLIDETVAAVDPDIELGLMIVHLQYSTYLLGRWQDLIDALGAEKVRPGGGLHDETWLYGYIEKPLSCARQLLEAEGALDIQYEYEDFPQTHYKSPKSHIIECTSALMCGCSGIAFASMPSLGNDDVMRAIQQARPMWDDIINTSHDWELYGATFLWSKDSTVYAGENTFTSQIARPFYAQAELFSFGNSLSYTPLLKNSVFTLLSDYHVHGLTDDEIKDIFTRGVVLDRAAANILKERGYGDLVGTAAEGTACRQFSGYLYENSLGGRVAVLNTLPSTTQVYTLEGTVNFREFIDWVSNGKMPLTTDEYRVASFIRQPEDRSEFMFMLINTTTDAKDEVTVSVLGEYEGDFICYDENGNSTTIPASAAVIENGRTTFTVPGMTCWGFCVVRTA